MLEGVSHRQATVLMQYGNANAQGSAEAGFSPWTPYYALRPTALYVPVSRRCADDTEARSLGLGPMSSYLLSTRASLYAGASSSIDSKYIGEGSASV